jgi:dTDP-4-amino-4,6-dideoxygalactose transaminase
MWEGCTPVFVDINPNDFCIDAGKIETAITENTQAIMATHVYGYPCDVEKIEQIAQKHNLKVIYDAAHAFGCTYNGKALLSYGDISTCSFHATKLFHTVEGGCIITNDDKIANQLMLYRQFGHVYDDYYSIGINGKNSEFHAAMGLCVFDDIEKIIDARRNLSAKYDKRLKGTGLEIPKVNKDNFIYNYAYYPVLFPSEAALLKAKKDLEAEGVNTRRYFYPSLNKLPYLEQSSCKQSEDIASRVLCLPFFYDLPDDAVDKISRILLSLK